MKQMKMTARNLITTVLTVILIGSLFVGTVSAIGDEPVDTSVQTLENVRDYTPATASNGTSYLVDGGKLYAGNPAGWQEVLLPTDVMAGVVATGNSETIYVGAANQMVLYRSQNSGRTWQRYALGTDVLGGITAIAVDSYQKLAYVGTDNDGVYRLRDVGSSMTVNGHLLLEEPVQEIAADSAGAGLAFVRTATNLYRAENMGLSWVQVNNLSSYATAVAITNSGTEFVPATVFVGTADRGLLQSVDGGHTWQLANEGLNMAPGSRLYIDALAIDPLQPEVLYVSTSYLLGSTTVTQSPALVAMSRDGAATWQSLGSDVANGGLVDDLMPIAGEAGALYALSTQSRSPLALGTATEMAPEMASIVEVPTETSLGSLLASARQNLAWLLATTSALVLMVIASIDFINGGGAGLFGRKEEENGRPAGAGA